MLCSGFAVWVMARSVNKWWLHSALLLLLCCCLPHGAAARPWRGTEPDLSWRGAAPGHHEPECSRARLLLQQMTGRRSPDRHSALGTDTQTHNYADKPTSDT